jgi:hypothetical protein
LKKQQLRASFAQKNLLRDIVDTGTAVAKVCCIEHTDLAGFPPEED